MLRLTALGNCSSPSHPAFEPEELSFTTGHFPHMNSLCAPLSRLSGPNAAALQAGL
jgi:hypothetical protein